MYSIRCLHCLVLAALPHAQAVVLRRWLVAPFLLSVPCLLYGRLSKRAALSPDPVVAQRSSLDRLRAAGVTQSLVQQVLPRRLNPLACRAAQRKCSALLRKAVSWPSAHPRKWAKRPQSLHRAPRAPRSGPMWCNRLHWLRRKPPSLLRRRLRPERQGLVVMRQVQALAQLLCLLDRLIPAARSCLRRGCLRSSQPPLQSPISSPATAQTLEPQFTTVLVLARASQHRQRHQPSRTWLHKFRARVLVLQRPMALRQTHGIRTWAVMRETLQWLSPVLLELVALQLQAA